MILKCVAIDDEPLAINILEGYIKQTPFLELSEKFTHPIKAYNYLSEHEIDLVFVDIQMPDLSGLEIITKLRHKPLVVFTTAYSEYAMEGFKADAIDYLLKPIDYPDFLKAANKAKSWFLANQVKLLNLQSNNDFIYIKSEHKLIRININDIKYIQGMSEYVKFHLINDKPIMSLLSLKSLELTLPEKRFMRVHKSFIVNLQKINFIERNEISCGDGTLIPISLQYKAGFQKFIEDNFML